MKKLWILIRSEYNQVVKKKSFLVGILLTPLFMVVVMVLPALLATKESTTTEQIAVVDLTQQEIGERLKESLERYQLDNGQPAYDVTDIYYPNPGDSAGFEALRERLDSMIISKGLRSYLVLDSNIESSDSAYMVAKSFSFTTSSRLERRLTDIISGIRLERSKINLGIDSVLHLTRSVCLTQKAPGGRERDFLTVYLGGIIFVMIIFATIIGYGQILMRSIIEEKNSRIIEVLVSSVSPFQLMASKVFGLGLASMTQVGVWAIIGLGLYSFRSDLNIGSDISSVVFNPVFVIYFIIYLLLGYIMYSTLFALIGSIVNTDKESQNFVFPITMTLLLPVMIAMYVIRDADSTISVVLSLIPFFTPTMMILRLNFVGIDTFSFSNPIIVEATFGVFLTAATALLIIWVTARIFRVGILMYGKRPTLPEIIKWIRYRR
jgi:ABC-2 type transport system permease protein